MNDSREDGLGSGLRPPEEPLMCRKRVWAAGSELATVKSSFSSPRRLIYRAPQS
jgi:hypothetical protein